MSGFYLEIYFPEKGVRFISLLDSYDNGKNQASNDTSTFILTFNDWYSKQNSIKIRNVLDAKRAWGNAIADISRHNDRNVPVEDLQLYMVAEFDTETLEITPKKDYLCSGPEFIKE